MAELAVVCGATGALGRAVVATLAARGDRIVAVARDAERVRALAEEAGPAVRGEAADLALPEEVEALWERIAAEGPPSWVVNTVGGYRGGTVAETDPDRYRFLLDLNLTTVWNSCRAAAARMTGRGGAIVNVGAKAAMAGGAGSAAYAVSKSGVVRLTEILAAELLGDGIRVNAVLPSVIDTDANRAEMPASLMERAVAPEAIAAVIAILCSDAARPISGAAIPVYGRA